MKQDAIIKLIEFEKGSNLDNVCEVLCEISRAIKKIIKTNFNGVILKASSETKPADLIEYYKKSAKINIYKDL